MIIKPLPSPTAIYWRVSALLGCGWLLTLVLIYSIRDYGPPNPFVVGLIIGTMFQLIVLASAWGALGPGKLLWRVPLSLVWTWTIGLAFALPELGRYSGRQVALVFMLVATALWALALLPLWLTAFAFRLRLRYQAESPDADTTKERQFGIRELMIFTTFVAVLAALAKLILNSQLIPDPDREFITVMSVLVVTQILVGVPLIFSGLLQQRVALATVVALVLVAVVTVLEHLTISQVMPRGMPRQEYYIFTWANIHSALWVLLFTAVVRGSGYRFGLPQPEQGIQYVGPMQERPFSPLPDKLAEIVFLPPAAEVSKDTPPSEVWHIQE